MEVRWTHRFPVRIPYELFSLHDDERRDSVLGKETGDEFLQRSLGRMRTRDGWSDDDDSAVH